MIEKNDLKNAFAKTLRDAGYVKKSDSWYMPGEEAIVVVNLQKSDHGNYYYLNTGICLKALSDESFLKVNKCHIQISANNLAIDRHSLDKGLNLEEGNSEDLAASMQVVGEQVLPKLSEFLSLSQLREHYKKSSFKAALMFWQARELLEMQIE